MTKFRKGMKKVLVGVTAFACVAVCGVGYATNGFRDWNGNETVSTEVSTPVYGGMVASSSNGRGIELVTTRKFAPTSQSEGTSVTITATMTTVGEIYDNTLSWTMAFDTSGNSDYKTWAQGKTCADYVNMTVAEDTHSVDVECIEAFGASIVITATSNQNEQSTASCRLDYVKRITGIAEEAFNQYLPSEWEEEYDSDYDPDRMEYLRFDDNDYCSRVIYSAGTLEPELISGDMFWLDGPANDGLTVALDRNGIVSERVDWVDNADPDMMLNGDRLATRLMLTLSCLGYQGDRPLTDSDKVRVNDYLYNELGEYGGTFNIECNVTLSIGYNGQVYQTYTYTTRTVDLTRDGLTEPAEITVSVDKSNVVL